MVTGARPCGPVVNRAHTIHLTTLQPYMAVGSLEQLEQGPQPPANEPRTPSQGHQLLNVSSPRLVRLTQPRSIEAQQRRMANLQVVCTRQPHSDLPVDGWCSLKLNMLIRGSTTTSRSISSRGLRTFSRSCSGGRRRSPLRRHPTTCPLATSALLADALNQVTTGEHCQMSL